MNAMMMGRREALAAGACDGRGALPRSMFAVVWTHVETRDEVVTGFGATAAAALADARVEGCPGVGYVFSILPIDWES